MSVPRPELIFVAGPQQGERAVLMTDRVVAGRSSTCDINLKEEFASRQQFVFMLTSDGWTMENLSTNGTRVNGKKYKQGKKLLFATGDVIGVGVDTQILYVSPGDDSEAALAQYRKSSAPFAGAESDHEAEQGNVNQPPPSGDLAVPPPVQAKPVVAAPPPQKFPAQTISGRAMPQAPVAVAEVPAAAATAPKKRSRRLVIIAVIGLGWTVVLAVIAAVLLSGKGGGDNESSSTPALLRHDEIAAALLKELPRPGKPDQAKADKALKDAQDLFPRQTTFARARYEVVKNYKIYLAYKAGQPLFDYSEQADHYQTACEGLVHDVLAVYDNAYSLEKNKNWAKAQIEFSKLMEMVPERDMNDPAYSKFISNVLTHLTYIRQQSVAKK